MLYEIIQRQSIGPPKIGPARANEKGIGLDTKTWVFGTTIEISTAKYERVGIRKHLDDDDDDEEDEDEDEEDD